jgi:hypothetical protein
MTEEIIYRGTNLEITRIQHHGGKPDYSFKVYDWKGYVEMILPQSGFKRLVDLLRREVEEKQKKK